jgi:hypothetical protein
MGMGRVFGGFQIGGCGNDESSNTDLDPRRLRRAHGSDLKRDCRAGLAGQT